MYNSAHTHFLGGAKNYIIKLICIYLYESVAFFSLDFLEIIIFKFAANFNKCFRKNMHK